MKKGTNKKNCNRLVTLFNALLIVLPKDVVRSREVAEHNVSNYITLHIIDFLDNKSI